jgi:hypothetical protein
MAVSARFYVDQITRRAYNPEHAEVLLKPAYNNGDGNQAWAEATPSGEIKLQIQNPSAVEWFAARLGVKDHDIHITFDDA